MTTPTGNRETPEVKIAERILFHVSDNREVAMWMDNLKRKEKTLLQG